ncbi:RDD family protein [Streptomyces sp. DSM 44915]|uniref:RDD family protein n=1 Tax=Streptomyces chisholmiae TaxID=3075540 RepID=A0ABU2JPC1_9ACTN|nr:RDD family protein [Streptomyces sp. DSM 44915]MDT0266835.1 RDD family protein [Streptomyces sp. DSM 44915]
MTETYGAPGTVPVGGEAAGGARAPSWRRIVAWLVDFSLVLVVATLLGTFTFQRISAMLTDAPGLAETGVWKVVTSGGDLGDAGRALGESLWNRSVRAVQQGFGLLVLAVFLYQFLALAFAGTTLGKGLVGLRVAGAREPRPGTEAPGPWRPSRRQAAVRAAVTTVADTALLALACVLLMAGAFLAAGFVLVLAVVVYLANAIPALVGRRRSLADRFAGTRVHGGLLGATAAATARYTAQGGRAAWQAAQRVAESERTRAVIGRGRQLIPGGRPASAPADPPDPTSATAVPGAPGGAGVPATASADPAGPNAPAGPSGLAGPGGPAGEPGRTGVPPGQPPAAAG